MLPVQEDAIWVSQLSSGIQLHDYEDVAQKLQHRALCEQYSDPHRQIGRPSKDISRAFQVIKGSMPCHHTIYVLHGLFCEGLYWAQGM